MNRVPPRWLRPRYQERRRCTSLSTKCCTMHRIDSHAFLLFCRLQYPSLPGAKGCMTQSPHPTNGAQSGAKRVPCGTGAWHASSGPDAPATQRRPSTVTMMRIQGRVACSGGVPRAALAVLALTLALILSLQCQTAAGEPAGRCRATRSVRFGGACCHRRGAATAACGRCHHPALLHTAWPSPLACSCRGCDAWHPVAAPGEPVGQLCLRVGAAVNGMVGAARLSGRFLPSPRSPCTPFTCLSPVTPLPAAPTKPSACTAASCRCALSLGTSRPARRTSARRGVLPSRTGRSTALVSVPQGC